VHTSKSSPIKQTINFAIPNSVFASVVIGDNIYVGGSFTELGYRGADWKRYIEELVSSPKKRRGGLQWN
jgi:hypothetical protein